jgi:hypothetical protein
MRRFSQAFVFLRCRRNFDLICDLGASAHLFSRGVIKVDYRSWDSVTKVENHQTCGVFRLQSEAE